MSIRNSLVQISTEQYKKSTDTEFKKTHLKCTPYAFEMKKFNISQKEYGEILTYPIQLNCDLLHRCFFEVTVPNINLNDNIINKINPGLYEDYIKNKDIILEKYQNNIKQWKNKFDDFKIYSNIQIEIYIEIIKNLKIDNITVENILEKVNSIKTKYQNIYETSGIKTEILEETDILNYITKINNNTPNDKIKSDIEKNINIKFKNINNYLEYYYNNKLYYEKLHDDKKQGKIFYKWIDNLAHHYFTNFTFLINGTIIDSYSNDYLHIKQNHSIYIDNYINYNKLIRNNDSLYNNNYYKKKLYIPLLFSFCTEGTNNVLPINILKNNSTLDIESKINDLKNLIYFQNWEEDFNNNLIINLHREDHGNKIIKKQFEPFDPSVNLILPQYIYSYKFDKINKFTLEHNYESINSKQILEIYGEEDTNGEYVIDQEHWIFMKNDLKNLKSSKSNQIPIAIKKLLLGYHYFIDDYEKLFDIIPKPEIYINLEYGYLDNTENYIFTKYPLQYIIQTREEIIVDNITENYNKQLSRIPGSLKEIYFFAQKKLLLNGYNNYSQSQLSNYDIKPLIDIDLQSKSLKLFFYSDEDSSNLLEYNSSGFNYVINTQLLKSQLPEGIYYKNISLSPESYQHSGSVVLSKVEHNFALTLDEEEYEKYLNNINNINKLGIQGKIIYVTYRSLNIANKSVSII